jgi:dipeptidyl aminopeptidase/acylaminoacyl peptidase
MRFAQALHWIQDTPAQDEEQSELRGHLRIESDVNTLWREVAHFQNRSEWFPAKTRLSKCKGMNREIFGKMNPESRSIPGDQKMIPPTIDEMMHMSFPGNVQVSPDGQWVLFTVRQAVGNAYYFRLFKAKADGSEVYLVVSPRGDLSKTSTTNPQWSPNGCLFSFVSKGNIWVRSLEDSRSWQVTFTEPGVTSYRWAPDGRSIAFVSTHPVSEAQEQRQRTARRIDDDRLKVCHLYVTSGIDPSGSKNVKARLVRTPGSILGFNWAPDSRSIAFSHVKSSAVADAWLADLSIVDLKTEAIRPLVHGPGHHFQAIYSPDGEWIAYSTDPPERRFQRAGAVMVVPASGGKPRQLASTPDQNPALLGWSADGKSIYVTECHRTLSGLYSVPFDGTPVRTITQEHRLAGIHLNSSRTVLGFTSEGLTDPPEVYIANVNEEAGFSPSRVSTLNQHVLRRLLPRQELIRWQSDRLEIEGILTYPFGFVKGKRCPLIVMPHGGPAASSTQAFPVKPNMFCRAMWADAGYAVLEPNFRGSLGYGPEFRLALIGDLGGKEFGDIMAGVDHVIDMGVADPEQLGIVGGSYGGYLAAWAPTQTDRFKLAIVSAGMTNMTSFAGTADVGNLVIDYLDDKTLSGRLVWERSPVQQVQKVSNTKYLILHGEADPRVPVGQGYELYRALERHGKSAQMFVYPGEGHTSYHHPHQQLHRMQTVVAWANRWIRSIIDGPSLRVDGTPQWITDPASIRPATGPSISELNQSTRTSQVKISTIKIPNTAASHSKPKNALVGESHSRRGSRPR